MAVNRYEVIGNLCKDPEIITTNSGKKIAKFSIATSEYAGKDSASGKAKYESEFHDVKVYGSAAEYCEKYLKKGSLAYVSGKKKTETWDKKDGSGKGYAFILQVGQSGRIERLSDPKPKDGAANGNGAAAAPPAEAVEDEIPF